MTQLNQPASEHGAWRAALRRWRAFPRLMRLLWELGPREVSLLIGFAVIDGLWPILDLELLRRLIDSAAGVITGALPFAEAALWLGAILLSSTLASVFGVIRQSRGEESRERLNARAQERLLVKASRLSLATLEQPMFYDQLDRAQRGMDERLLMTLENLSTLPGHLVMAAGLLIYVGSAHWLFPVILLAGLLPSHFSWIWLGRRRYELARKHTPSERKLTYLGKLMTGRAGAAEIRLFGLQAHLFERQQQLFRRLRDERLSLALKTVRSITLPIFGEQLTYGVVIAGVVALIARGQLSIGSFAAYLGAAERFRDSLGGILFVARSTDEDLRFIGDLLDYLDLEEEPRTGTRRVNQEPTKDQRLMTNSVSPDHLVTLSSCHPVTVRFEAVTFAYPGTERPVLDGVNLTIHPGERVALVGENGAGKSTLARLLLGLYQPTAGRITVGGSDLGQLDRHWWRRQTAAVFQEYVKYELTARENIGFGDLHRLDDMGAIRAAAARGGADRLVAQLPAGYETPLGRAYDEHGQDLSIGQWQKLAIARAALRDATLLVLDEPTAALDARAEVDVYRQFRDMAEGRSVLLISHRLGSARLADRIAVLEGGRIVEEGTHAELMALSGRYARMYAVQAQWYL